MIPRPISRREALRLSGAALLLAPWTALGDEGSFEFVAINDTHYLDDECRPFQANVVRSMRADAPKAEFVCHAGDVADRGAADELKTMQDLYAEADLPMHPVPGNHDFIKGTDRTGYDTVFPGKLNYTFVHAGWQFLAFDTTQGTDFDQTKVAPETLAWLDEQTGKLDPKLPTFAFTHFPLGDGVELRPLNADAVVDRLLKFNLKWVHCGHWHGESVRSANSATLTTSRCCARLRTNRDGSPLKGWHVYRASADGTLSRRFVSLSA
jgi:Calcineurin-like phosphoesterase